MKLAVQPCITQLIKDYINENLYMMLTCRLFPLRKWTIF